MFWLIHRRESCRCGACGSAEVKLRGQVVRRFRGLPIGRKAVTLALPIPRLECLDCREVRQASVAFAEPRRSYSKSFARYALELSRVMTIQDVAHHQGVSWDVIEEIVKQDLQRRFGKPNLKRLRRIAIDEISVGKGHRYVTVVLDLDSGAVVHVGEGKGGDAHKLCSPPQLHRATMEIHTKMPNDMPPLGRNRMRL